MRTYPKDSRQAATAVGFGFLTYMLSEFMSGSQAPMVELPQGRLTGIVSKSREGWSYFEYLGIPYARPPVGDLRFEPPQPPGNWSGVRNANQYAPECMQFELMVTARVVGSENCLYLNVFTPTLESLQKPGEKPLPVMVFFHGGYFMAGSSNMYRAKYFMDQDIVLVTVNYRLAALGFLNTGDNIVRGNMGLKDQNMALRWIQENIRKFGGDPSSVTIFGESAGAASVHYHIVSPQSRGLFHRAISQSGTSLQTWALTMDPQTQAKRLAARYRCPTRNSMEMVSCLKRVDASALVQYHQAAMSATSHPHDNFLPTLEVIKSPDAFLVDYPANLISKGHFNKVPWMSGVNAGEGLLNVARLLANSALTEGLNKNWWDSFPRMLSYNPALRNVTERIRRFYFGQKKKLNPFKQLANFTNLFSDRLFFYGAHKAALFHAAHAPMYLYYNNYESDISVFSLMKGVSPLSSFAAELQIAYDMAKDFLYSVTFGNWYQGLGPCHADELPLLFNMHMLADVSSSSKDYHMSRAMVKLWTDFAKNENPLSFEGVAWPQAHAVHNSTGKLLYMMLDRRPRVIQEPFTERVKFWDTLPV